MIDAMGGQHTKYYADFVTLACEAYNILRKSSNLILNLFSLMVDARIPDIQGEKSIFKVCFFNSYFFFVGLAFRVDNYKSLYISSCLCVK